MTRLLMAVLSAVLFSTAVHAQVSARPAVLYLTPERAETDITLSNTAGTSTRLRFTAVGQTGAAGEGSGAGSCADWCILSPTELQLAPDRSAIVHARFEPPHGLPDGEYHASILIRENDVIHERIAVHFRIGDVYSDVSLANVSVERSKEDVRFQLHLKQLGNAAYRGNLQLRIEDDRGKTIFTSTDRVDVYGMATLDYMLSAETVRKGTYRLFLNFDSDREDLGEHAIPVLPKKFSVKISMS